MKKILGVSHPIPKKFAERIYNHGKNVFVSKKSLKKAIKGDKFLIYESRGSHAYTGWADIISNGLEKTDEILKKYENNLIVTKNEFIEYSKNRSEMNIIQFENFEKFKKPVPPNRFVSIGGKYIYEDEFKMIKSNKG